MHLRKIWLFTAAVLAALALAATGSARLDATDGGSSGKASTLVFGAEQRRARLVPQPDPRCRLRHVLERRLPDTGHPRRVPLGAQLHVQV
jgi:hypothetical protein